jgi:hypothetical protein
MPWLPQSACSRVPVWRLLAVIVNALVARHRLTIRCWRARHWECGIADLQAGFDRDGSGEASPVAKSWALGDPPSHR